MRAPAALATPYRDAARATAAGSKSFYMATRFFPPALARSAHAVYWFCRTTDDIVDECPDPGQARRDLDRWERMLGLALRDGHAAHPVLAVFAETAARHAIPHQYPLDLVAGMRMDLERNRYETFQQLRLFCYRAASVVGLMMSHVIGFREPAPRHAIDLGIAMQLSNILRDVGEDLGRGRIYLPLEEMERFGYREQDLLAGRRNQGFLDLMRYQVARARHYYAEASPGIALLDPRGRFAVRVAADVYREILGRIEASGYDVFTRRAVVPAWRKYWLVARAMAVPAARHSASRLAFWSST